NQYNGVTFSDYSAFKICDYHAPDIIANGNTTFCKNDSVVLSAGDDGTHQYQWMKNGNTINGATQSSYTAKKTGYYTVHIDNGSCDDISDSLQVTVNALPTATIYPTGPINICQGDTFTLHANGGNLYSYQWSKNGNNIIGATDNTY